MSAQPRTTASLTLPQGDYWTIKQGDVETDEDGIQKLWVTYTRSNQGGFEDFELVCHYSPVTDDYPVIVYDKRSYDPTVPVEYRTHPLLTETYDTWADAHERIDQLVQLDEFEAYLASKMGESR
jgi:hypothetical protein